MKTVSAITELSKWNRQGLYLYTAGDLGKIFDEAGERLRSTIKRLVSAGVLTHVCRNLYCYDFSVQPHENILDHIAIALRRGEYVFESLESAASKWGIISQIPVDRLTVMTTGNSGEVATPYGIVEFTHTAASSQDILANTVTRPDSPLPIATLRYTIHNLLRCGRSTQLIDWEEVQVHEV